MRVSVPGTCSTPEVDALNVCSGVINKTLDADKGDPLGYDACPQHAVRLDQGYSIRNPKGPLAKFPFSPG